MRDEYNLRIDRGVHEGGAAIITAPLYPSGSSDEPLAEAKRRTRYAVWMVGRALLSESGRSELAEAVLVLTGLVSEEAANWLVPLLEDGSPVLDRSTPTAVKYMSQRIGMFLAWVDLGIQQAIEEERARIQALPDLWGAMEAVVSIVGTFLPGVGGIAADTVALILGRVKPDLDLEGQVAEYQAALKVYRRGFSRLAQQTLQALLAKSSRSMANPRVPLFVADHAAYVLRGWDEELRFLEA